MKKNVKKLLSAILALAMVFTVAACGSTEDISEPTGEITPVTIGDEVFVPEEESYIFNLSYDTEIYNGALDLQVLRYFDGGMYAVLSDSVSGECQLCSISDLGELTECSDYVAVEQSDVPNAISYPVFLDLTADGTLVVIDYIYGYTEGTDGSYQYASAYYLRSLTDTGAEISSVKLDGVSNLGTVGGAALKPDGAVLVCYDGKCVAFDLDGNKLFDVDIGKTEITGLVKLRDGRIGAVVKRDINSLYVVEDALDGKESAVALPEGVSAGELVTGAGYYDFCYTSGASFYGVNINDRRTDELLNWINSGIVSDELQAVRMFSDGTVAAVKKDYSYYFDSASVNLVSVKKLPASSDSRAVVTVGAVYSDYALWYGLIDFNNVNQYYRAELTDYSQHGEKAYDMLLADMQAGNGPDVIYAGQLEDSQFEDMAGQGLLVDLYPKLDDDIALSRKDYNAEALAAGEYNGGLYAEISELSLKVYAGLKETIGDKTSLTTEEVQTLAAGLSEKTAAVYDPAVFSGEAFKEDYQALKDKDCVLIPVEIGNLTDIAALVYQTSSDISFVKLDDQPSVASQRGYAMNAKGSNLDSAWAFVGYFLNYDYQTSYSSGLPSNVHALKAATKADAETVAAMYSDSELIRSDYLLNQLNSILAD